VLHKLQESVTASDKDRGKNHQVFERSFDCKLITTEHFFLQKLNYIQNNPCSGVWNLVKNPVDYEHSSARHYIGEKSVYTMRMNSSADIDSSRFDRVIKQKGMNWLHIYNAEDLPKRYRIRAYPTLILINNEGQIIYDEWNTEDKKDVLIKLLKEM